MKLTGKISDRIAKGEIPADAMTYTRSEDAEQPKASSVRHASGHALGKGALRDGTRKR